MKGKTAPLIENLLEDFHMPQGMTALLTSCFINILTIRGKVGLLLLGVPLPLYIPLPKVFFSEPHSFSKELKSFLSAALEIFYFPFQQRDEVSFKIYFTSLSELTKFLEKSIL